MHFHSLNIKESFLISQPPFKDERGSFNIFWERSFFKINGINFSPINAYHSNNLKLGTLRGLHYQVEPHCQAKLVSCVNGSIFDVMVDMRKDSPTYLKWEGMELSANSGKAIYIPAGCAHGFISLTDNSTVAYLIEGEYVPINATILHWNDPAIGIKWPETEQLILSEQDSNAPFLKI